MKVHSQPDFDPETRHYWFLDGRMVGYMFSLVTASADGASITANLDFPRMLPLITHLGVRKDGNLIAACLAAPNDVRPSTAAIFYIYSPDEDSLKSMLARVVNQCIEFGVDNVIADLINGHSQYEAVYQKLGFKKVAEWARCEKDLLC